MAKKHILIVPGDGIGQEVTLVGKKVLDKIAVKFNHEFSYDEALIGHVAIEVTGNPLPDETLQKMRNADAVLFGAGFVEDEKRVGLVCQPSPDKII